MFSRSVNLGSNFSAHGLISAHVRPNLIILEISVNPLRNYFTWMGGWFPFQLSITSKIGALKIPNPEVSRGLCPLTFSRALPFNKRNHYICLIYNRWPHHAFPPLETPAAWTPVNVSWSLTLNDDTFRPEAEVADKEQKKEVEVPKDAVNAQADAKDGDKSAAEKMEH